MRTDFNISLSQRENVLLKANKALQTQTAFGSSLVSEVLQYGSLLPPWMFSVPCFQLPCLCPGQGPVLGVLLLLLTDTLSQIHLCPWLQLLPPCYWVAKQCFQLGS